MSRSSRCFGKSSIGVPFSKLKMIDISQILGTCGGLLHLKQPVAGHDEDVASLPAIRLPPLPNGLQGVVHLDQVQHQIILAFEMDYAMNGAAVRLSGVKRHRFRVCIAKTCGPKRGFASGNVGGQNQQVDVVGQAWISMDHHGQSTAEGIGDARCVQGIHGANELFPDIHLQQYSRHRRR